MELGDDELVTMLRDMMRNCPFGREDFSPEAREILRGRRDEYIRLQAMLDQRAAESLDGRPAAWEPTADFETMAPEDRREYFELLGREQFVSEAIRWLNWLLD